ncbi:hypothetical protein HPP92_002554 [Vanilla planifolia]|uniref:Longin domain-containing protein n=1 Tax=Vanilla planifolia TaxID=51239 RepID=A0A835SDZ8_VANPL|nr:hypothetical protein HPP92_002554 [Vanilla planifolia]
MPVKIHVTFDQIVVSWPKKLKQGTSQNLSPQSPRRRSAPVSSSSRCCSDRMIRECDPGCPILYASVSRGSTVLADFLAGGDDDPAHSGDLASLAAQCLGAVPRFHLLYTHTARRRIYAFLMAEPLLFFAIADESIGRPAILLFLNQLRDATWHAARRMVLSSNSLTHRCLQVELLPVIRRVVLTFSASTLEEKPSPSISSTPPSSDSHLLTGKHKRKDKRQKKAIEGEDVDGGFRREVEFEISVMNDDGDTDLGFGEGDGRKLVKRIWRRHVRMVIVMDLIVCSLLFGIWLSVCRGFQCTSE